MALALDLGALKSRLSREGAQSGAITASLIWNDPSDLDLHAFVKRNGKGNVDHIFYAHKKAAAGYLDVDMNVRETGKGFSLEPVENIFWKSPPGGEYRICVQNAGTKSSPTKWDGKFTDHNRSIPFKVFLNRDGEIEEFAGTWKPGDGQIECFKFNVEGSGDIADTGGGGNYLVFPPEDVKTTFKELCAKHEVTWRIGGGFYAVARKEKIQAGKEMLLQHLASDNFTIGAGKCRDALGWPAGELNKGPGDILEGHRLFVQSTSANRVIPPGTHVLFEVDDAEYAKHRKTHHIDAEAHTSGTAGMSAAAKAEAKAAAKASPKAKAKADPAPPPAAKASPKAKAKASPEIACTASEAEQHEFLDLARDYSWDALKRKLNANPTLVGVQPAQRWSALHQAAASGDADIVRFLLEKEAPVDAKNKDGQTPLDVATDESIKTLLRARGTKRKAEAEPEPKAKAKAKAKAKGKALAGKKIVFTGTLSTARAAASAAATAAGATVLSAVSGNMDILIAGPGAGAKMAKAESMGKEVWDEEQFKAAAGL
eukprot:TRINITY_DN26843_c0_g2_i1.p1 TRINITY_DN26843_c0_g2~~TRINITY_DN26843_c0_g2_i1.p1  ORF type:complete len:541 (+),score=79.38 TRINITY_DN26843_c0_g2_i1:58-1680(+)